MSQQVQVMINPNGDDKSVRLTGDDKSKCCFIMCDPMTTRQLEQLYLMCITATAIGAYMISYIGFVGVFRNDTSSNDVVWSSVGVISITSLGLAVILNVFKLIAKHSVLSDSKSVFWQIIVGCRMCLSLLNFFCVVEIYRDANYAGVLIVNFIISLIDQILLSVYVYYHFKMYGWPHNHYKVNTTNGNNVEIIG
eukprot:UN04977